MSYQVTFTQTNNPDKPPITVADGTIDNTTSLQFVGKNYAGYGTVIANDFLHLLENFANDTAPLNPVQGQLWFDTAASVNLLKVYDGSSWNPAGSLKKSGTAPAAATSGDLWVNTTTSQLYLYSGSAWILIGPQFSAGLQTGPIVESIVDTSNISHNVVTFYASSSSNNTESYRIAIISKDTFTPKAAVTGFQTINEGFNLSTVNSTSATSLSRIWGTAQQADALLVGSNTVAAANFLRGDTTTIANYPINVRNDGGITLGANLGFNIGITGTTTVLYSKNSGNSVEFATNNSGTVITAMHLSADAKLGIGANNANPQSTLDVIGGVTVKDDPTSHAVNWTANTPYSVNTYVIYNNFYYQITSAGISGTTGPVHTSGSASDGTVTLLYIGNVPTSPVPGRIIITGTSDVGASSISPFDPGGASIQTAGGLSVGKKSSFGDDITSYGQIFINYLDASSNPVAASVIQPGTDSAANLYDIGTSNRPFRNVYAQAFQGNFSGTFTGSLTGSITGAAAKLQSATTFLLTGDVSSPGVVFDGQTATGTVTFNTSINQGIITSKNEATDSALNDQLLVYQASSSQLVKMSKQALFKHTATVPVGALFPFAGSKTTLPAGYLLCDGSEVKTSDYPQLFAVLGYTYKAALLLIGLSTFALPDFRGRIPLGADNMNNGLTVPAADGSNIQINAGGGIANRITEVTADTVGASGGNQTVTLGLSNLPDHKHSLNDGNAQYFAVGGPNPSTDPYTGVSTGKGLTVQNQLGQGYGLSDSGSVISSQLATPFTVLQPYTTINYIIFTGVI
jgi:microcystin-dependent protein